MSLPDPPEEAKKPRARRLIWIVPGVAALIAAAAIGYALTDKRAEKPDRAQVEVGLATEQSQDASVPDPGLVEQSPNGPLPIIGKDGRQAWQVYAKHFDKDDARPRVAIVVGGLGLDGDATHAAIEGLPPNVTLAFSPYAHELGTWIGAARKAGHEVMLGLPMEPTDYPRQDPGPETLLISLDPAKNLERLDWVLGRGTAYVGVVGIMGDRFTAERDSLQPMLGELKKRGLLFVDDHDASKSVAGPLARDLGMAWAIANRTIDDDPTGDSVDKALAALVATATQDGAALGLGGAPIPVTITHVAQWAATLQAKGVVLAPATSVAGRQKLPMPAP